MNIITSTTTDKKKLYQMTKGANVKRIQDNEGKTITVKNYVLYEETKNTGDIVAVLCVEDQDGGLYASNSPTFRESFLDISHICGDNPVDMIGEDVRIEAGTSKAGRKFFTCVWA